MSYAAASQQGAERGVIWGFSLYSFLFPLDNRKLEPTETADFGLQVGEASAEVFPRLTMERTSHNWSRTVQNFL